MTQKNSESVATTLQHHRDHFRLAHIPPPQQLDRAKTPPTPRGLGAVPRGPPLGSGACQARGRPARCDASGRRKSDLCGYGATVVGPWLGLARRRCVVGRLGLLGDGRLARRGVEAAAGAGAGARRSWGGWGGFGWGGWSGAAAGARTREEPGGAWPSGLLLVVVVSWWCRPVGRPQEGL